MIKRILMVVTTADQINENERTGLWLSEFVEPYLAFNNKGYEVTIASPLGGKVPLDHRSLEGAPQEMLDMAKYLKDTMKLENVNDIHSYDAIFIPGGHGTMFDMPDNEVLQSIIRTMYESGKIVAAVCHGPAALVGVKLSDGTPLVAGKTIAAFTDEEERETTLDKYMPFLLETRLRELGANIVLAPNWTDNFQVDGNLITSQNPQSAESAAKEVIRQLNK
ncbi:type 1 glutamine amidotransferase domain-containing protein [Paenibacillus chondroitinus]|uniref:Type 1 glutamine amidotransferase domain-containing protein n=1 Tax=Paenibacillus chondroitinus TaxID=59842 RepID=A0ABU6D976_9BACL|nr:MULTISPECIES: type 1 glutamine amidotransferase domain-containing protein [Paenibacillus]MCY9656610.1 type 1 glutamine amidotransferase domain-containing protein [Paenibacillus anseongense]MEB4794259.1 type 1 glutamine amidotransferase domain-containing protein [Paenibacillus chondroitinus]